MRKFGLELKPIQICEYYVGYGEKALAIDFLAYIMKARPVLCLTDFDKRDREKILKFVRNKVYCALLSSIDTEILFDDKDLELQRNYKALRNSVKRKGDYYVLEVHDRKYRLPINEFEMPVFYHKYGLPELPQEVIEELKGKDFIDGGAYIGDGALVLSEFKPHKIYAFEPLSENFHLLNKTIQLNNISSIVVPIKKL